MEGTGPTKNQLLFIKKLRESSVERDKALNEFLKEHKKGDVEELGFMSNLVHTGCLGFTPALVHTDIIGFMRPNCSHRFC